MANRANALTYVFVAKWPLFSHHRNHKRNVRDRVEILFSEPLLFFSAHKELNMKTLTKSRVLFGLALALGWPRSWKCMEMDMQVFAIPPEGLPCL